MFPKKASFSDKVIQGVFVEKYKRKPGNCIGLSVYSFRLYLLMNGLNKTNYWFKVAARNLKEFY
jgi:hypothetical protein